MKTELTIACKLTGPAFQERRNKVLRETANSRLEVRELEDGFAYRFPVEWKSLGLFTSVKKTYLMSFKDWQYAFVNGMALADQKAAYESSTIPESKTVARGGLTNAAKVDFAKPHAPLLLTSGSTDHIIPAHLNLRNFKKYKKSDSVLDYKEFPGRNHFVVGQPTWKEDADHILNWIAKQQGRGIVKEFLNLKEIVKPIDSPKVHVARV